MGELEVCVRPKNRIFDELSFDLASTEDQVDTEGLIDHFYYHGKPKAEKAKRADIISALNVAISETRVAQA